MNEQGLLSPLCHLNTVALVMLPCPLFSPQRVPAWNAQRASTRGPPSRKGSLSMEDTFESISELGPLELMGRELDLAPYGTLRKSQSADSLNSISSVSNTFGQDFTLGQVEVSMDYDAASHTLHVAVLQGKDLLEREEASFESCFMRVSLRPEEQIVGISRVSGGCRAGQRGVVPLGSLPSWEGQQRQAGSEEGAGVRVWMLVPEPKVLTRQSAELELGASTCRHPLCTILSIPTTRIQCGVLVHFHTWPCVNLGPWQGRDDTFKLANLGTA